MAKNTFAILGILAVLLMSLGVVSAADIEITDLSVSETVVENERDFIFTFKLTYTGGSNNTNILFDDSSISPFGDLFISNANATGMNGSINESRTITGIISDFAGRGGQELTVFINATNSFARNDTTSFIVSITPYNFCDDFEGENGTLEISDFEITNLGEGDDEEWELLDNIEIEVEIENTDKDDDVDDVMVEIMILDNSGNDVTNDFDLDDEEVDLGRIKDDDSEVAIFRIKEIPADLDDGKYKLYFRAYSDGDEESHCIASSNDLDDNTYQEIEVVRLNGQAVVVKPESMKVLASCGDENVEVLLDVYNLGDDKEEKILVTLYSSVLNVNEKLIIDDLRSGKREEIMFVFDVPQELDKKYYNLKIITYYDYDDDEDELSEYSYGESSYNDLDKDFSVRLEILSCKSLALDPTVSASLESVAEMGTELVVKTTITNNDEDNDFIISASDFDEWATLVSIIPQTISIDEGGSAEVIITFNPTATGSHSFKINTIVDGESHEQLVSVNIEEEPGIFSGIKNTTLYIIAGIFAVLILIVLTVIVKASRKRARPEF